MRKSVTGTIMMMVLAVMLFHAGVQTTHAAYSYQNEDTQNYVLIEDAADLFTDEEEELLSEVMWPITEHGHAVCVTVSKNDLTAEDYAEDFYESYFEQDDGTLFLIDMDNRKLWLYNSGDISYTITSAYSDTITDNVYTMATREQYYDCAAETFTQVTALLEGPSIPQPMKYIGNALLALILAFFVNYLLMHRLGRSRLTVEEQQMEHILNRYRVSEIKKKKYKTERTLHSSGGSSDGSSGGGGGGGGSSSGGGHSF
ncbi:MAG: TPM domain-containing protein [Eubacteriales bacterium]|nr:TPM domain-containing protein [Eubacteriales bacterium]